MRNSITTKIILTIFLMVVVPLVAGGAWFYSDQQASFAKVETERGASDLQAAHHMFDYMGENWASFVKTNAYWSDHHEAIENGDQDFLTQSVLGSMDANSSLVAVFDTDLQGKIIAKREVKPFGFEALIPKVVQKLGKDMAVTGLVQTDQGLQMLGASKVTDEEGKAEPNGIMFFLEPVDENFVKKIKDVNNTDIALFDGKTVATTDEHFDKSTAANLFAKVKASAAPVSISTRQETVQTTQTTDKIVDLFGQPIGFLATETSSASGANIRAELLKTAGAAGVLLVLVASLISYLFYSQLTKPLKRLSSEMSRVASGDLSGHAIATKRQDEIGEIVTAFAAMTEGLKGLVRKVHEGSNVLTDRSHEFAATTHEARNTLNQIAATSEDINGLVDRTFIQVEASVSKLLTLEQQAQNISAASQTAVCAAEQMKEAASAGQNEVELSINTMLGVKTSSEDNETRVLALQQVAEEIHAIVDRIKAISKQTGMLALNASIEAARAGEHGRGFNIVAKEVGKLSDQAREATEEIEALVGRIETSVVDVCETTGDLKQKLSDGVTAVELTRLSFTEILRHVESVEGQIRQIRTEAAQQEAITQEGVAAISDVKQMAAGMVHSVGDASAATEEALSSMVSIAENSDQVAELAEDLLGDVSKFRV